ncbi:MAG: sensor histidine kinase [Desulfobulbaceae bacterium]
MPSLATYWQDMRRSLSEVDYTFVALRVLCLLGGAALLIAVPLPPVEKDLLGKALAAFTFYSAVCYLVIFLRPGILRRVYFVSLFLDLIFLTYLVRYQSFLGSSLFIGFYLLVCLHTIYFGLRFGLLVATLTAFLHLLSRSFDEGAVGWPDMALRLAFLYLLAVPVGLLSERVKKEKRTVDQLNAELARSLQNLRTTRDKLIEAEKFSALGRLTAYIAHEIRNPLTAAGGFARRLEKKLAPGSQEKEYASILVNEVNRLEKILLDTLIYGKAGDRKLARADLNTPARAAASLYRHLCQEHNITLREQFAPDLPPAIVDCGQVQQALDSLITNSIHAMPEGGTLTIRTGRTSRNNASYLTITVSDSGPGIESEIVDYIFEPFYSTKKIGVGTGLGLPIVKKIMDEHYGLIEVRNRPGQGVSFTLFFPWQSVEQDLMTPCWEFLRCGIETDAARRCNAFPYFGRICWVTAGTFGPGGIDGICAQKLENCRDCSFYKIVNSSLPLYTGESQQDHDRPSSPPPQ